MERLKEGRKEGKQVRWNGAREVGKERERDGMKGGKKGRKEREGME